MYQHAYDTMKKMWLKIIISIDHIIFGFMSHTMLQNFAQVTGQQNSLYRPFQLALGCTIVSYGTHLSTSENLT